MVVDHVQDDRHCQTVRFIDEPPKVVRLAIESRRREEVSTVVAPAELAGELSNRLDLQGGNARVGKRRQFPDGRFPGSFLSERANMHFVDHLAISWHALPGVVRPAKVPRVNDLRRTMRAVRLKA